MFRTQVFLFFRNIFGALFKIVGFPEPPPDKGWADVERFYDTMQHKFKFTLNQKGKCFLVFVCAHLTQKTK
jgi:hypothetical protein